MKPYQVICNDINRKHRETVIGCGRKDGQTILYFKSGRWGYEMECSLYDPAVQAAATLSRAALNDAANEARALGSDCAD